MDRQPENLDIAHAVKEKIIKFELHTIHIVAIHIPENAFYCRPTM